MCNITAVRDALLLLAGAVALAASSGIFGLAWINAGFLAWLMYLGLGAAVGWSIAAGVLLNEAVKALNAFCSCAAGSTACSAACSKLKALLGFIATVLLFLIAACIAKMINPLNNWASLVIVVAATLLTVALFALLAFGLELGKCQSAGASGPGPIPPPQGPGTAPF